MSKFSIERRKWQGRKVWAAIDDEQMVRGRFETVDDAFQHLIEEHEAEPQKIVLPEGYVVVQFEHTDTFGGEANYSWVERHSMALPNTVKDRHIAKLAKAWAGWSGMKGRSEHYNGDTYKFVPYGMCQVLFATVEY